MTAALAITAEPPVRLRLSRHGLGTGAAVAVAGLVALAGAWVALSPTETEVMQAAVSAKDYAAARGHFTIDPGDEVRSGKLALMVRARVGDGDIDGALRLLDQAAVSRTGQIERTRQRAAVLRTANRLPELQRELETIARLTGLAADKRAVLDVARGRGDMPSERAMLGSLANLSTGETERLADLDRAAGQADEARLRLRGVLDAGQALSPGATATLLTLSWQHAEAAEIAQTIAALQRRGGTVPSPEQAVASLVAAGRPVVALAFAEANAGAYPLALAAPRVDLLRRAGRIAEARSLFARVAATGTIDAATIVRIGFELDAVDTIFTTLDAGRIAQLPPGLALDLARRAAHAGRWTSIAGIDRAAAGDWRRLDPWFAMQLARRAGDAAGALRWARSIDGATGSNAQEAILRDSGDRAGLRRLWLARAGASDGATRAVIADQLLDNGDKADSVKLLGDAAAHAAPASAAVKRLLYVWGPRPPAAALAWLRERAKATTDPEQRLAWLKLYADRDAPGSALAVLSVEPDASTTPLRLLQLDLAASVGDRVAQRRIVDSLLDGRTLLVTDLDRLQAMLPDTTPPAQRLDVVRRLLAAGRGTPQMQLDLAWDAFNRRRPADARKPLLAYLTVRPADAAALMLMGSIEKASGDAAAARSWSERALAAAGSAPTELRIQILEQLGRLDEGLATVGVLRQASPGDDRLLALNARLLIAAGHPAAAQKLLATRPT